MKINRHLTALAVALALPGLAAAEQGRVYINPAVGAIDWGSDTHLSDETFYQIGAEIGLSENLGLEFKYNQADSANVQRGPGDVDFSTFGADLIYYLGRFGGGRWQPYLAGGVGHGTYDASGASDDEQTFGNVGLGVRYHLNESWSLRADARALNSFDAEETHGVYTLGISYAFGGNGPAAEPAPAPAPAAPAPVDSDGDGVTDDRDRCPDTPRGRAVDEYGCEYVLKQTETIRMEVLFGFDSAEIPEQFMGEVEKTAKFLNQYGGASARIEGHTDSVGTEAYNQKLSQERADAVRQVLVNRFGIDSGRLNAVGHGESQPIASNDDDAGRRQNRRVVAVVEAETEEPAMR